MPQTPNRNWTYPAKGTKPYFDEIADFYDEIDADVESIATSSNIVSSVLGRTGDVVATAGDYDSDEVTNTSTVSGSTVSDALETLDTKTVSTDTVTIDGDGNSTDIRLTTPGFVTTVNGVTNILSHTDRRFQVATGTATDYTLQLPDATQLNSRDFFDVANASTQKIVVQNSNQTLLYNMYPGGYAKFRLIDNDTAAGIWSQPSGASKVQDIEVLPATDTGTNFVDKILKGDYVQNLIEWSEDLSQAEHVKVRMTVSGTEDLIASTDNASHSFRPLNNIVTAGKYTIRLLAKPGDRDWVCISNTGSSQLAYFDLVNKQIRNQTVGTEATISDFDGTWTEIEFASNFSVGVNQVFIYIAEDNGVLAYAGDGVTVSGSVKEVQYREGVPTQRVSYIKTEDSINTGAEQISFAEVPVETKTFISVGDSISFGLPDGDNPYTNFLKTLQPEYDFINVAISGERTTEISREQLIRATGLLEWDFRESYFPFTSYNSGVLSIDSNGFRVEKGAVNGGATAFLLPINVDIRITGTVSGDGTANPTIIVNGTGGTLWTGDTTADQEIDVTYTSTVQKEAVRLVCNGGIAGNFVQFRDLKIEITDNTKVADIGIFSLIGINDIVNDVTDEVMKEALDFNFWQIRNSGNKAIALEILPFGNSGLWTSAREAQRLRINNWLKDYSKASYFVDMDYLDDGSGNLYSAFDYGDGVHLNVRGNQAIAETINRRYFAGYKIPDELSSEELVVSSATETVEPYHNKVYVDYTSTGSVTLTIATSRIVNKHKDIRIIDTGANASINNITIETEGSETINGESSLIINSDRTSITLLSDGSNLFIV